MLILCALVPSSLAQAQADPLYPVLECWDQAGDTEVRLHFGVTNLLTAEVTPSLNDFTVDAVPIPAPPSFLPGYSPRVFSVTVPTSSGPVSWALGQPDYVLSVDPSNLDPDEQCSSVAGVEGPAGPAGQSAGQLLTECELVTASIPEGKEYGTELLIACAADETLMQGGGVCGKGNLRGSYQVNATTWKVVCRSPKGIQGSALCCPHD
jgi:hypothetical protein